MFASGKRGTRWYNRGDPVDADFTQADFVADNTWREKSLASIVPAGMKIVKIHSQCYQATANKGLQFRKKGQTNESNKTLAQTQVTNITVPGWHEVWLDSTRSVEYKLSSGTWPYIRVTVSSYGR